MIRSLSKQIVIMFVAAFYLLTPQISFANQCTLESTYLPRSAWRHNTFIELVCSPGAGMFSAVMSLLGALEIYQNRLASGVEITYGKDGEYGPYYDETVGANWWEYYYEPISVGIRNGHNIVATSDGKFNFPFSLIAVHRMSRKRAHYLLSTHVHVKEHIQKCVDDFVKRQFNSNSVIGVHYRGTDKSTEARRVSHKKFIKAINKVIAGLDTDDFQIFVATDEQPFLDSLIQLFPEKVTFYEGMSRSVDEKPMHLGSPTPYKAGADALIDCLLLSRCNSIVRTTSHLSHVATFFNPTIPVTLVK